MYSVLLGAVPQRAPAATQRGTPRRSPDQQRTSRSSRHPPPASALLALALTALALIALTLTLLAPAAQASQTVQMHASFSPDVAGASTTIAFSFAIASDDGGVPSPLRSIDLHLPAGIGLARNSLGTALCNPAELYETGNEGCPPNSRLGFGSALAEIPYGPEVVQEGASVYAYRGTPVNENITILFFAEAFHPVFAVLVFPGELMAGSGPFSGSIDTEVPLIPSVPGGPNVSVVQFTSTFGPRGLTYEEQVHGRTIYFHPRGVSVPHTCPAGGFPFVAEVGFEDSSSQTATTTAPCPAPVHHHSAAHNSASHRSRR